MGIFTLIPTLLTILGDLPKVLAALMALKQAVVDAEATGMDGPTKLTKVLNDFEVAINVINPTWAGEFDTIAKDVEMVVNDIVGIFNEFAHAAPAKPAA
jgi:hypothetical protein